MDKRARPRFVAGQRARVIQRAVPDVHVAGGVELAGALHRDSAPVTGLGHGIVAIQIGVATGRVIRQRGEHNRRQRRRWRIQNSTGQYGDPGAFDEFDDGSRLNRDRDVAGDQDGLIDHVDRAGRPRLIGGQQSLVPGHGIVDQHRLGDVAEHCAG